MPVIPVATVYDGPFLSYSCKVSVKEGATSLLSGQVPVKLKERNVQEDMVMNIDGFSIAAIVIIVVGTVWAFYEENIRK